MRRSLTLITACLALGMLALIAPACGGTDEQVGSEQCDNSIDDDADGLTDCADPDCAGADSCTNVGIEHCYNLVDDNDGLADFLVAEW